MSLSKTGRLRHLFFFITLELDLTLFAITRLGDGGERRGRKEKEQKERKSARKKEGVREDRR